MPQFAPSKRKFIFFNTRVLGGRRKPEGRHRSPMKRDVWKEKKIWWERREVLRRKRKPLEEEMS